MRKDTSIGPDAAAPAPVGPSPPVKPPPTALWLRVLSRLPLPVLYALSGALLWGLRRVGHRLAVARDNLRCSFPELSQAQIEQLVRDNYRHLGQVTAEILKTASISAEELRARVRLLNAERVHAETRAGRSVILLGAHQGNWEWVLQGVTLGLEVPLDGAYKPLHGAAADRWLLRLRERFGARLIVAKRMLREIARRRHVVRAVSLIPDQVPSTSEGRLWLTFLGRETAFYPGPGEIARSTGYAAFFVSMTRVRRGYYEVDFQPISAAGACLEPVVFTARYAQRLEAAIRAQPAHWMWTHRRWKLTPPVLSPVPSSPMAAAPDAGLTIDSTSRR